MDSKKKIIAGLLMAMIILSVAPVQTAQATSDYGASTWAVYFKNVIGKAAAQAAFRALSNQILSKIRTGGRGGKPAFVQNWLNFITQSQAQGEGIFRAELSNTTLCSYFGNDLKKIFGVNPQIKTPLTGLNTRTDSLQPFNLRSNCTLPSNFSMTNYQKDFAGNGGWDTWAKILEPQNNPYGVALLSQDEVQKQRALSQASNVNQAVSGNGFLGLENGCKALGLGNVCLNFGSIKTPGSTLNLAANDATSGGTVALLAAADGASVAVSALTTWAINKMFDQGLAGSSDSSTDVNITTEQRTTESYAQEFCTADNNISKEASNYVMTKFPQAFKDYPPSKPSCTGNLCGTSYCVWSTSKYGKDNTYPYSRCSQACLKAAGEAPSIAAPATPEPVPPEEEGAQPPADAGTKHGDHTAEVAAAKAQLTNEGMTFSQSSPDCPDRFAITKRAAQLIGNGAGLLDKPSGNNCGGFAGDIIAFPDGYIYDVLNGTAADGSGPMWEPSGCGPVGGDGTCSDRYRPVP